MLNVIGILFLSLSAVSAVAQLHFGFHSSISDRETEYRCALTIAPSATPVTVQYRTVAGTAIAGEDFVAASGSLTFEPGQTAVSFVIDLIDDALVEGDEFFYLEIYSAPPWYELRRYTFQISDEESGYEVYAWPTPEDQSSLGATVRRHGDFDFASTIEVFVEPGTAKPGVDYTDRRVTLNFQPGSDVSKDVEIPLINNRLQDGERTLRLRIANPLPAVPLERDSALGIIVDNDTGYFFENEELGIKLTGSFYEGGTPHAILHRVGASGPSELTLQIRGLTGYASLETVAAEGEDFLPGPLTIRFEAGQTNAIVALPIINDALAEQTERFVIEHRRSLNDAIWFQNTQWFAIEDNEFNPLPVASFCPPGLWHLTPSVVPAGNGKAFLPFDNNIVRIDLTGALDQTFTPVPCPAVFRLIPLADGRVAVLSDPNGNVQLSIFDKENGAMMPGFQPFADLRIDTVVSGLGGKLYVASIGNNRPSRIVRLNSDGSVDTSFAAVNTTSFSQIPLVATHTGGVYVGNQWTTLNGEFLPAPALLTPAGQIDRSFRSAQRSDPVIERNGTLYALASGGEFFRLRPDGSLDPGFQRRFIGYGHVIPDGADFLIISQVQGGFIIERQLSDGGPDPEFFRGVIETREDAYSTDVSLIDRTLIVRGLYGRVNGKELACEPLVRVTLQAEPRFLVEPKDHELREHVQVDGLHVIRTGANADSTASVRYRLRDGSAANGIDFKAIAEGELNFPPGESRAAIPFEMTDDGILEEKDAFYVDLLNAAGDILSTTEVTVLSDEVGVKMLRQVSANTWEILPINHHSQSVRLYWSFDLVTWPGSSRHSSNEPITFWSDRPQQFFKAAPYP